MLDLTALTAQVDRTVTLEGEAVTAISTNDQAAIDALTAKLVTSNDALDAALHPPTPTP